MTPPRPEVISALRSCRMWRAADDASIVALAGTARVETVARGQLLANEGDIPDRFGVVVAGKVKVYHLGADGRELTFETMGSGEPIAAVAALAGARYPATVESATDATIAWLPREAIFDLIESQPGLARSLVADLANRVVNLTAVATSLSLDVPSRLAGYLFQRALSVGQATPEGLVVELGMSKGELASALGTVPETLSRAFARLRDEGVVEVRARDVVVLDVGQLARMGSGYSEE
ncbi:MAG: Crp/Fnr family transcriptional regulator [Coriobacteriia bacterium]|nr:Crp/Fnr family transcriptional regulator [Coriobacteriia bacterium]